jgi:hypothetical protein
VTLQHLIYSSERALEKQERQRKKFFDLLYASKPIEPQPRASSVSAAPRNVPTKSTTFMATTASIEPQNALKKSSNEGASDDELRFSSTYLYETHQKPSTFDHHFAEEQPRHELDQWMENNGTASRANNLGHSHPLSEEDLDEDEGFLLHGRNTLH